MNTPGFLATLTWIGAYLLGGVLSSVLEMVWMFRSTSLVTDLEEMDSASLGFAAIFFALAPFVLASWMARRVYRHRKAALEREAEGS